MARQRLTHATQVGLLTAIGIQPDTRLPFAGERVQGHAGFIDPDSLDGACQQDIDPQRVFR